MSHHSEHQHPPATKIKPHVKWIAIVAVVLMIGAMLVYVFTMDEAVVPGQPVSEPVSASP